ncbi:hypothetical protein [Spirosoma pomorum]
MNKGLQLLILVLACTSLSCKRDQKKIVEDYLRYSNSYDTTSVKKSIDDSFMIYNNPVSENQNLNLADFQYTGGKIVLFSISKSDSVIKTTEQWTSAIDSLLDVKIKLIVHNSYRFKNNKIKSITIDSVENVRAYKAEQTKNSMGLLAYVNAEHPNFTSSDRMKNLLKLTAEYHSLSPSKKKEYLIKSLLNGSKFISNNMFGMELDFKSKTIVVISTMGVRVPTTYSIEEEMIYIKPLEGSLPMLLSFKDNNTLVGDYLLGKYTFYRSE